MAQAAMCCCDGSCCCCKGLAERSMETGTTPSPTLDWCKEFWMPANKPSPIHMIWTFVIEVFALIPLYYAWPEEHPPLVTCPNGLRFYRVLAGFIALNMIFAIVMRFRTSRMFTLATSAEELSLAKKMRVFKIDVPTVYSFVWLLLFQTIWLGGRDFILGSKERSYGTCTGAAPAPSVTILVFQWAFIIGSCLLFVVCLVIHSTRSDKKSRLGRSSLRMGVDPFDEYEEDLLPLAPTSGMDALERAAAHAPPTNTRPHSASTVNPSTNRTTNPIDAGGDHVGLHTSPAQTDPRRAQRPAVNVTPPPREAIESSRAIEW